MPFDPNNIKDRNSNLIELMVVDFIDNNWQQCFPSGFRLEFCKECKKYKGETVDKDDYIHRKRVSHLDYQDKRSAAIDILKKRKQVKQPAPAPARTNVPVPNALARAHPPSIQLLAQRADLTIVDVPGDSDCFFAAVLKAMPQLKTASESKEEFFLDQRHQVAMLISAEFDMFKDRQEEENMNPLYSAIDNSSILAVLYTELVVTLHGMGSDHKLLATSDELEKWLQEHTLAPKDRTDINTRNRYTTSLEIAAFALLHQIIIVVYLDLQWQRAGSAYEPHVFDGGNNGVVRLLLTGDSESYVRRGGDNISRNIYEARNHFKALVPRSS